MKYISKKASQISFPLGGIGTGCIGLSGNGSLIDVEKIALTRTQLPNLPILQ